MFKRTKTESHESSLYLETGVEYKIKTINNLTVDGKILKISLMITSEKIKYMVFSEVTDVHSICLTGGPCMGAVTKLKTNILQAISELKNNKNLIGIRIDYEYPDKNGSIAIDFNYIKMV